MRVVMMGTGTFAEPTLEALLAGPDQVVGVFTQPDREGANRRGSTRQVGRGMKEIASEKGIPVFQPDKVNTPEGVAMLRSVQPDLIVVAAYGQILSKEVLSIPTQGAINIHGSLLPKYRGAAPVAWAILNGETETGVTIIRMSVGLDAGDILAGAVIPIGNETAGELEAKLAPIGAKLAKMTIEDLKAGRIIQGEKQDPSLVTKAPKLTKEMGLIDWTKRSDQVCRQIRAMQPWPTAYTYLHRPGKASIRVLVYQTAFLDGFWLPEFDGAVLGRLAIGPGGMWALAGNRSAVKVLELQPAGKKRMTADEFLRGHPLKEGDRFGPEQVS